MFYNLWVGMLHEQSGYILTFNEFKDLRPGKVITHEMKVFPIAPEVHIQRIYKTSF